MTKKRILIVEDEIATSLAEQQIIRDLGYEVAGVALSGDIAVQRAGEVKPDLVLMDLRLMGDMDGREAGLKIRELYRIPVVYVTGLGDKKTSEAGKFTMPEGIGYVVKPFTKEELGSEIKRLIG